MFTGYWIENGFIWGPRESGQYWIKDGWIYGTKNSGEVLDTR